jgi:hypothetical protein
MEQATTIHNQSQQATTTLQQATTIHYNPTPTHNDHTTIQNETQPSHNNPKINYDKPLNCMRHTGIPSIPKWLQNPPCSTGMAVYSSAVCHGLFLGCCGIVVSRSGSLWDPILLLHCVSSLWVVVGLLWIIVGSLWLVVGSLWLVVGSLWLVVDHCGSSGVVVDHCLLLWLVVGSLWLVLDCCGVVAAGCESLCGWRGWLWFIVGSL